MGGGETGGVRERGYNDDTLVSLEETSSHSLNVSD